jgi:hypothetical protein
MPLYTSLLASVNRNLFAGCFPEGDLLSKVFYEYGSGAPVVADGAGRSIR